jgi:hypothetical protein
MSVSSYKKKLKEERIINLVITFLYLIPFIGFLVLFIIGINYISIFQTGLFIVYAVLTGLYINMTFGYQFKTYQINSETQNKEIIKRIKRQRINIITISLISIIFLAIYAYNLTNIIAFGCPTVGGTLRDIELLDQYEETGYYLKDINDNHQHQHHDKRDVNFLPATAVHNFVLYRLCNDENVLFYIVLFFLFYILLLHGFTIVAYIRNIGMWKREESLKYNHFIIILLHFIPLCLLLFFQIILVYKVSVIQSGLLVPFGLLNGILLSLITNTSNKRFEITWINRILIILASLLSMGFVVLYIINLSSNYAQCSGPINFPIIPITNKMFTDFMIVEICNHEFIYSIFILIYIYYIMVLNLFTALMFIFYFKINLINSYCPIHFFCLLSPHTPKKKFYVISG